MVSMFIDPHEKLFELNKIRQINIKSSTNDYWYVKTGFFEPYAIDVAAFAVLHIAWVASVYIMYTQFNLATYLYCKYWRTILSQITI